VSQLKENLRKGFKGSLSIYATTFVNIIGGFAISVILVRGLTLTEYGNFKLIGSILFVGTYLCSLGVEKSLLRFGAEFVTRCELKRLITLLWTSVLLRGLALVLFFFVFFTFQKQLAHFFNLPRPLIELMPLVFVLLFFQVMNTLWGNSFYAARMDHVNDSYNKIVVRILTVLGYACVLWFGFGLTGIIVTLLITQVLSALHYGILNRKWFAMVRVQWQSKKQTLWEKDLVKRISRFSLFSFLGTNMYILRNVTIDNFVISRYLSTEEVALYGLVSTIIIYISQFNPVAVLKGVLNPLFVGRYTETGNRDELIFGHSLLTKLSIFSTLPIYTFTILMGGKIIALIYSPEYLASVNTLIIFCVFFFFSALGSPFNPMIYTLEKTEIFLIVGVLSIYNLVMDIILVPKFGIAGAAIATGSTGMFQFFIYWAAFRWYVKLDIVFPWRALWKTSLNLVPLIIIAIYLNPYIKNLTHLLVFSILSALLYLAISSFNRVFNEEERGLFNRAMGKELWLF